MAAVACSKEDNMAPDPVITEIEDSEWAQVKENAFKAFDDARAEFFAGIPSAFDAKKLKPKGIQNLAELPPPPVEPGDEVTYEVEYSDSVSYSEIAEEEYDVQERIQALAWEAKQTGDMTGLQNFLQEVGLYDKFLEVVSKYNLEQHTKNLSVKRKAISKDKFINTAFRDGDIFVKCDASSANISSLSVASGSALIGAIGYLIIGKWGHAAFLDTEKRGKEDNYFLLSSSNETDTYKGDWWNALGRVGHDKVEGYWTNATEVAVTRPRNSTASQGRAAIAYARQFSGKPWNIITSRSANDKFYCSKLVYRGWLSQGYELEPHKYDLTGLPWIGYLVVQWKHKKVWFGRIIYPVFSIEYIKDTWVTPKNLYESTDKIASF
jgi:hypothetical protein